eukprot:scaffold196838_cov20-Tisochrysis_lutea.AAC.1
MVGGVIAFLLCMHSKICTGALPPWLHPGPEVPGNSGIEDPACASMPPSQVPPWAHPDLSCKFGG